MFFNNSHRNVEKYFSFLEYYVSLVFELQKILHFIIIILAVTFLVVE